MEKINIAIADDHKLFRKGIIALLSDFEFVNKTFEASNGAELLGLLSKLDVLPDLILLDLRMPVMDGVEAHQNIKELYPDIKVIILTMEDDEQYILHLISEGVNGYLLKNADPDEMELAIQKVHENGFYFAENISAMIIKSMHRKDKHENILNPEFTERELEALALICKDFSNAEIAEEMGIAIRTVEGYKLKLLDKSGAKHIAGLVILAIKYNWVSI
jgi:DNA-binding NarL/FixJ family response regulator